MRLGARVWLLAAVALAICVAAMVVASQDASAAARPIGRGPYETGWLYADVQTSTKTYATPVKVFYPAAHEGEGEAANLTGAPYPAVIWLPFMGGNREVQGLEILQPLCSWGFIAVAVSVNWADFGNSANPSDINDLLDWLEALSANDTSPLHGMVKEGSYGISGHSSGGGLSVLDGVLVPRIKAFQPFAPAIGLATVDALAPRCAKPVLVQVGAQDVDYIDSSLEIWDAFTCQRSLVVISSGGHGGPFEVYLLCAFYKYWLSGEDGYRTFLYGVEAMRDVEAGTYSLRFNLSAEDFFPPVLSARASATDAPMDAPVVFNGSIRGYHPVGQTSAAFAWDLDGDGRDDVTHATDTDATWAFRSPGGFDVTFALRMGVFSVAIPLPIHVSVHDVAPVAVLGPDMTVDQDFEVRIDASASSDTPSDIGRLQYLWTFDGGPALTTGVPYVTRTYTEVGAHLVALTVRDPWGEASDATMNVTVLNVLPEVRAFADANHVDEDQAVSMVAEANDTPTDLPRLRFMWTFGDGYGTDWSSSNASGHTFTSRGQFNVTATVKDGSGATASATIVVRVDDPAPWARVLTPGNGSRFVEERVIDFKAEAFDTPSDADGLLARWDFGDGNVTDWTSVARMGVAHAYLLTGEYRAAIEVMDDEGASSRTSLFIFIMNPAPEATIVRPSGFITVPEDTVVAFEGVGTDTPSQADSLAYAWEADGEWLPGARVERAFTRAGIYVVVLRVTDPEGEHAEANVTVRVTNLPPEAEASVTPLAVHVGDLVNFTGQGHDTPTDEASLIMRWDLGDGNRTEDLTGSHAYLRAGDYTVTFTVIDDDGANATMAFHVRVDATPPIPPPPPGPDGTEGERGLPPMGMMAGIAVVVAIVALTAALLSRRRKGDGGGSGAIIGP